MRELSMLIHIYLLLMLRNGYWLVILLVDMMWMACFFLEHFLGEVTFYFCILILIFLSFIVVFKAGFPKRILLEKHYPSQFRQLTKYMYPAECIYLSILGAHYMVIAFITLEKSSHGNYF